MQCSNNLKQIGLGAHNFHDVYKRLPPGYLGPVDQTTRVPTDDPAAGANGTNCQAVCGLVHILPYIEQSPLYDQLDALMELGVDYAPAPSTSPRGKGTLGWW
jgi:hypothetical protein